MSTSKITKFSKDLKAVLVKHDAEMKIDDSYPDVPVISVILSGKSYELGYYFDKDWMV